MSGTRVAGTIAGVTAAAAAALLAHRREARIRERLVDELRSLARPVPEGPVAVARMPELPTPVARYFRHVLAERQVPIRLARLMQEGELRTAPTSPRWMPFTATQRVAPGAPGFVWNATVRTPYGTHVRVLDAYVAGAGRGRASLLSTLPVGRARPGPELDAGALHRYLAEGPWCPTALLPQAGVVWSAVDDRTARATLSDGHTTVSLEFRFADSGVVTSVYTPARYRRTASGYEAAAWEGHFDDYQYLHGMRIPCYGEVGWYDDGTLRPVWRGQIVRAAYEVATHERTARHP